MTEHRNLADGAIVPPAACTTAAAVRTEALEPTLEQLAIQREELRELANIQAATKRLVALAERRAELGRRVAGFLDPAEQRLAHAERTGRYDAVVEVPNGRRIAARIKTAIGELADPAGGRQRHAAARTDLHALFETFGADVFAPRIAYHLGKGRTLALRGEYSHWQKATDSAAAC